LLMILFLSQMAFPKSVNIVFRLDDFRLVHDSVNEKIVHLFMKYRIPLVLGVIPCDDNENLKFDSTNYFLPYLRDRVHEGLIEIALHGLNHKKMTPFGEMKGLCLEEQFRRIKKGKTLLESIFNIPIVTYIPPWNSHDENTVTALKRNKIYIVSSSVYDIWLESVFYPMSLDDYNDLEPVIFNDKDFGGVIVVMLHSYDFILPSSMKECENVLVNIKKLPYVRFYTFKGIEADSIYVNNIQSDDQIKQNLLSKIMRTKGYYIPVDVHYIIQILNAIIYLIIFFMSYLIVQMFILKKHKHNLYQYEILFFCASIVVLSTWYYLWGPLKLLLIDVLLAISLTVVFRFFKLYDTSVQFKIKKK